MTLILNESFARFGFLKKRSHGPVYRVQCHVACLVVSYIFGVKVAFTIDDDGRTDAVSTFVQLGRGSLRNIYESWRHGRSVPFLIICYCLRKRRFSYANLEKCCYSTVESSRVESSRVLFIVAACWSGDDHIPKVETSRFCRRIWKGTWIFSTLSASGTTKDADASDWKVHLSYYYSLRAYVILSTVTCLQLVQLLTTHVIFPKNCLAEWWLTDSCFFVL